MPRLRSVAPIVAILVFGLAAVGIGPGTGAVAALGGCLNNCTWLTISLTGDGDGTVQTITAIGGSPNGLISCGRSGGVTTGTCAHKYQNTFPPQNLSIPLRVTSQANYQGCITDPATGCTGSTAHAVSYDFTPNGFSADTTEAVALNPILPVPLEITRTDTGSGSVTSSPAGLSCPTTCYFQFPEGITVTLTAHPDAGSVIAGWLVNGCDPETDICPCPGTPQTCQVPLSGPVGNPVPVDVKFDPAPPPTAPPTPKPTPLPSHTPAPTAPPTTPPTAPPTAPPTVPPTTRPSASPTAAPGTSAGPTAATGTPAPGSTSGASTQPGGPTGSAALGSETPSSPGPAPTDAASAGASGAGPTGGLPGTTEPPTASPAAADTSILPLVGGGVVLLVLVIGGGLAIASRRRA